MSITYWNFLLPIMFLLKKNVKYFSSITYCKLKFVYVVVVPSIVKSQLSLKLLFCDILRIICHIDFTCRSINFLRQRKQQTKYQKLGVVSLIPREEGYSEPRQTYKIEHFTKIDNDWKPLTIFAKSSIISVWLFSEYTTVEYHWSWIVMSVRIMA